MINYGMFSRRNIEKYFLSVVGKCDRRTKEYIRTLAGDVEKAHKCGLRDGRNGKSLVTKEELTKGLPDKSELMRSVLDMAYESYRAGHIVGTTERRLKDESA